MRAQRLLPFGRSWIQVTTRRKTRRSLNRQAPGLKTRVTCYRNLAPTGMRRKVASRESRSREGVGPGGVARPNHTTDRRDTKKANTPTLNRIGMMQGYHQSIPRKPVARGNDVSRLVVLHHLCSARAKEEHPSGWGMKAIRDLFGASCSAQSSECYDLRLGEEDALTLIKRVVSTFLKQ
jgi:hypothetical protein